MKKKIAIVLAIITIISKFFGFFREIILSYFYGVSNESDAYIIALTIPTVIFAFVGTGLATTFIPIYNSILAQKGEKAANAFTNKVINIIFVISSVIVLLIFVFTEHTVKLFAYGFDKETMELAVQFTRIISLGIYFIGLGYVFKSLLQIKDNFIVPAIVGFPYNFIVIISIIASTKWNIMILPLGTFIATSLETIVLFPGIIKSGYKYLLDFKIDNHIKKMFFLSIPVILGTSVNQINKLVDRTLASQISVGGISALNYASRLNNFVQGVFVVSVIAVMYPAISKLAAENNMKELKKVLSESIIGVTLLLVPLSVGAMIFSKEIVALLFGRGAFDKTAVDMTSVSLFYYSIGMLAFGIRDVLSRVFYSVKDTKTPTINAGIGMALNIVLNIILSRYMGIGGLALATSIVGIFITILMFVTLRKKIGPLGMKAMSFKFFKILVSSLLMGVIAHISYRYLENFAGSNISIIISITGGALIYFVIIYFMKIEDVEVLVKQFKRKLFGRKKQLNNG
ncbi:MAG TPA: murein biosynthesis integral membrane protein MurJ [Hungateiclostridium thermocellum]|uniref:Probable lipid II flippase MurJ n=2 Tax=Acetivibrio thermocellus TaxID=1515 RepID=A3DIQ6_ACET2|nr:murein biosynthesis integral membrane protein MurJ [Acetivibrio thermocellus]CDG37100.1 integral membrane protein MviN [Acetivibrio thermocellus BC1]ABN53835.1 integral membrane protein MviN [Acetivibrio thermocellus ATCC 27405]ADU73319.1 integral membrane protein MviN [Acetivibrio thermocellus DSM 1313]ALX07237.1 integral membrane protein MviN [Acetivibrio thermocellus AD2]ANV74973.1 integral membrane protein MviN [Acetivibrio thermocellus DSM 2360]